MAFQSRRKHFCFRNEIDITQDRRIGSRSWTLYEAWFLFLSLAVSNMLNHGSTKELNERELLFQIFLRRFYWPCSSKTELSCLFFLHYVWALRCWRSYCWKQRPVSDGKTRVRSFLPGYEVFYLGTAFLTRYEVFLPGYEVFYLGMQFFILVWSFYRCMKFFFTWAWSFFYLDMKFFT
jgi:hypothetical protein